MAISRVEISDFGVFTGSFSEEFCAGVNIIIGSNGTGKTTLLRAIAIKPLIGNISDNSLMSSLLPSLRKVDSVEVFPFQDTKYNPNKHIFIPESDIISHPELFPLAQQYRLSYNNAEIDILRKALLPITNEIKPNAAKVLDKIKSIIGGDVVYENDTFFIVKSNGNKIPFALEASGYRKLGLLWKLLRNGLLESESVLFWDEPENSLNPELISDLVDILLELSRNGVQIFITTHSEILASYFSVNQLPDDAVLFYSLRKDENERIVSDSNNRFDLLAHNKLTEAPVKLYEKQITKGL